MRMTPQNPFARRCPPRTGPSGCRVRSRAAQTPCGFVVVEGPPSTNGKETAAPAAVSFPLGIVWASRSHWPSQLGGATPSRQPGRADAGRGDHAGAPPQPDGPEFDIITGFAFRIFLDALFAAWKPGPPNPDERAIEVIKLVVQPRGLVIQVVKTTVGAFLNAYLHAHGLGLLAPADTRRLSDVVGSILDALPGPAQHGTLLNDLSLFEDGVYAEGGRLIDSPDVHARLRDWIDQESSQRRATPKPQRRASAICRSGRPRLADGALTP